ncbi:hypothetical protein BCR36DRAFT_397296 [Piromyces finnis]|uniref:Periplasmic binding protein-like II n=1 Tax=Piromyces finnis TaxID=1754191 RepID=A0A1Y1VA97_9FUNG|nr:hypothetical protein BCR36DRAFT_397296 [Piromyces finnis]|eukprot:ORX51096.1 hypothetical protein BCR36DRAFT_397296 [Piromyces finnis]
MLIRIILSLILLSRIYVVVYGITVNFYTFSYEDKCEYLEEITNDFNDYSKKNGLDIHLNRILLSPRNISVYVNDYDSTVESILKKKNKSYDLFMISAVYTNFFDPYVENLRYYVSEETLESYLHGISSSLGIINDKIIGLPLYLEVGVFYSNKVLLEKYNKTIPQTWNQLIDTASYILEEEKKIGNNDLIGYLGYFPESEGIIGSFIEFLNSFRASYDMGLPSFNSQNAIDALIKIKEIKDSISSGIKK